jgi:hypothetical protein
MSRPFAIAVVGLLLLLSGSCLGGLLGPYRKPVLVWGFFVGTTMVLGGLTITLMRLISEGPPRS